jgi:hypothetical protein
LPEDLWAIGVQLAKILNEMGKAKRVLNEEHLSFFRYDRVHKKVVSILLHPKTLLLYD